MPIVPGNIPDPKQPVQKNRFIPELLEIDNIPSAAGFGKAKSIFYNDFIPGGK